MPSTVVDAGDATVNVQKSPPVELTFYYGRNLIGKKKGTNIYWELIRVIKKSKTEYKHHSFSS